LLFVNDVEYFNLLFFWSSEMSQANVQTEQSEVQEVKKITVFDVSRDVRSRYAKNLKNQIKELAQALDSGKTSPEDWVPVGLPVNPGKGTSFLPNNMVRLILAEIKNGYGDPRWMTEAQAMRYDQPFRSKQKQIVLQKIVNPKTGKEMVDSKTGEVITQKGVNLLRPTIIRIHQADDSVNPETDEKVYGKTTYLKDKDGNDRQVPEGGKIKSYPVYSPYKVYNAVQFANFPALDMDQRESLPGQNASDEMLLEGFKECIHVIEKEQSNEHFIELSAQRGALYNVLTQGAFGFSADKIDTAALKALGSTEDNNQFFKAVSIVAGVLRRAAGLDVAPEQESKESEDNRPRMR
jgi:hypothetical protein